MTKKPTDLVKIIKLTPGTLIINLQDSANFSEEKEFIIDYNKEFIKVPVSFAASIFQIDSTMKSYQKGYFDFDKDEKKDIFAYAKSQNLYYGEEDQGEEPTYEQPKKVYSKKEITEFVTNNNIEKIQGIINNKLQPQIDLLINIAKEKSSEMNFNLIKFIEENTGVGIVEGDE